MSKDDDTQQRKTLELRELQTRVDSLEQTIREGDSSQNPSLSPFQLIAAATCSTAAISLAAIGIGAPDHVYQIAITAVLIGYWYHQGILVIPSEPISRLLIVFNFALFSMLTKLLLGGGVRYPFYWAKLPEVSLSKNYLDSLWGSSLGKYELSWIPSELAQWNIDFTTVQSFLLLVLIVGMMTGFQLLMSLVAIILLILALPTLLTVDWSFAFPAMMFAVVSFYLQTPAANPRNRLR